jgi:AcrR family transcriptional regulator
MKENKNTKEIILEAAEAVFLEKGFDQARTVSIAQRAGVTHAMLHYYFRTKEQLFDKILDRKIGLIEEIITSLFSAPDLPLKDRLTQVISKHFDLLVANPSLPRFLMGEMNRVAPLMKERVLAKVLPALNDLQKEIDMDASQLLLDILSQNIFPFLMVPVLGLMGVDAERKEAQLEIIKQENITIILKRLDLV